MRNFILKSIVLLGVASLFLIPEAYYVMHPEFFVNSLKLICISLSAMIILLLKSHKDSGGGNLSKIGDITIPFFSSNISINVANVVESAIFSYAIFTIGLCVYSLAMNNLATPIISTAFAYVYYGLIIACCILFIALVKKKV